MERRDYIQRQIEQIGHFIARILGLASQNPAEAARLADEALSRTTGFSLSMLRRLGANGLIRTLGRERAHAMAGLFEAAANALRAAGRESEATEIAAIGKALSAGSSTPP